MGLTRFILTAVSCSCAAFAAAQNIPAGTVLPVTLSSTLDTRHDKPGQPISVKIMQDVPLPSGARIPAGAHVLGHVLEATRATGASPARLTISFDRVQTKGQEIPVATNLRAIASFVEVDDAEIPTMSTPDRGSPPSTWTTEQIGGDIVYRGGGPVTEDDSVVGKPVGSSPSGGVLAVLRPEPDAGCPEGNDREQALWLFSSDVCGAYGFSGLRIVPAVSTQPTGQISFESPREIHIPAGSALLLLVR